MRLPISRRPLARLDARGSLEAALDRTAYGSLLAGLALLPLGGVLFEIGFGVSVAATAGSLALGGTLRLPRYWPAAAAFLGLSLLSCLLSSDPLRSLDSWRKLLYLLAGLSALRQRPRIGSLARVFLILASGVGLHSATGIGAWFAWGGELRTHVDYLQLAQMVVMALALVLPMSLGAAFPLRLRLWAGGLSLLLALHVLLSGSRSALLCLGALSLAEILRRSRPALLLLPPLAFLVYETLPTVHQVRIREALVVESEEQVPPSSLRMRLDMVRTGLTILAEHPWLGVGPSGVERVYEAYKLGSLLDDPSASDSPRRRKWHNLHNDYVQVAAETGLLGLGAYLVLLGQILLSPLRRTREPGGDEAAELQRGVRLALWLFALGGLFYRSLLSFYPWRMFVVLAALDGSLSVHGGSTKRRSAERTAGATSEGERPEFLMEEPGPADKAWSPEES